jgi:flagellar biosynthesis component FlhA
VAVELQTGKLAPSVKDQEGESKKREEREKMTGLTVIEMATCFVEHLTESIPTGLRELIHGKIHVVA